VSSLILANKKAFGKYPESLAFSGAGNRNRTGMGIATRRILSPVRLPVAFKPTFYRVYDLPTCSRHTGYYIINIPHFVYVVNIVHLRKYYNVSSSPSYRPIDGD